MQDLHCRLKVDDNADWWGHIVSGKKGREAGCGARRVSGLWRCFWAGLASLLACARVG
jgi:hypothetical protein